MLAFTDTKVTKTELLRSLHAHLKADRIHQNIGYWVHQEHRAQKENNSLYPWVGCAVGCTLYEFAGPRAAGDHNRYEDLFGIPEKLAHLEDAIFENLPRDRARSWPLEFIKSITPGVDLYPAIDLWRNWIFESVDIALYDGNKSWEQARILTRRELLGESVDGEFRALWKELSAKKYSDFFGPESIVMSLSGEDDVTDTAMHTVSSVAYAVAENEDSHSEAWSHMADGLLAALERASAMTTKAAS